MSKCYRLIITLLFIATVIVGPLAMEAALEAHAEGLRGGQAARWDKISPELRSLLASNPTRAVDIIVLMNTSIPAPSTDIADKPERAAGRKIEKHGGVKSKGLGIVAGASGKITLDRLAALSKEPDVRYIAYDMPLVPTGSPYSGESVDFSRAVNANEVWGRGIYGSGVTVAVIDSGVEPLSDGVDRARLVASVDLVHGRRDSEDPGGHGTHVAGIIAGKKSGWSGVAPEANVVSVRVVDETGRGSMSTAIRGIQWVVQNRQTYGIRIINLSLGAPATTSYAQDPLAAAVEIAWHAGLVVVAAAGNDGPASGTISTPGHDPYAVTVGAVDMNATVDRKDDAVTPWSSRGPTINGLAKPDVVAPGRKIVSSLVADSYLSQLYPERVVESSYFRLSGTSQATAAVSGVAALMLSANPGLNPNQVKRQLVATATKLNGFRAEDQGAGYVDAGAAVRPGVGWATRLARPADSFAMVVYPLIKGKSPLRWKDSNYNGGVDSRGIPWSNVMWDNVMWDNVTWDNLLWDNVMWDNVMWDNLLWDNVMWDNVLWDNVMWDNVMWDTVGSID